MVDEMFRYTRRIGPDPDETKKSKGGTRKIADLPRRCRDPLHDPPRHMVYEPGVYEHTCPSCGVKQIFTVSRCEWNCEGLEVPKPFFESSRIDNIARHGWSMRRGARTSAG